MGNQFCADPLQVAVELLESGSFGPGGSFVCVPVFLVNGLFQGQFTTGPVDDDPDVNGVGGFGGRSEYEMQAACIGALFTVR